MDGAAREVCDESNGTLEKDEASSSQDKDMTKAECVGG